MSKGLTTQGEEIKWGDCGKFGSFDFAPVVGLCGWGKGKCAKYRMVKIE